MVICVYRLCGSFGDADYARSCVSFCFVGQSIYGSYGESFSPCSALTQSYCFLFGTIYIQLVNGKVLNSFVLVTILYIPGPPRRYLLLESVVVVVSSGEDTGGGEYVVDCSVCCCVIQRYARGNF
jgi:hypothetical protein